MNIGVCVKSTPDTDTRIKVLGDGSGIETAGIKWIISPYDAYALEKAVLTAKKTKGDVIIFTVGPDSVQKNIRDGLAVGGTRAVHVWDAALENADARAIALALAKAIEAEDCGYVFCGKVAADDDSQQVPAMLAELLGCPQVTQAIEFEGDASGFTATRTVGGGIEEVVKGSTPVLISAERGLATPRYAKLPAIMKAKRKKIAKKGLGDLGLSADDVAPKVTVANWTPPAERPAGRILTGEREAVVSELVSLLRNEAKVI